MSRYSLSPDKIDKEKLDLREECISIYDQRLRILFWNEACVKKFNIGPDMAMGKVLTDLFPFIRTDYRVKCLQEAAITGEYFFFPGFNYQYREGSYTQLIIPLKNASNKVVGCVNVVRDESSGRPGSKEDLLQILSTD